MQCCRCWSSLSSPACWPPAGVDQIIPQGHFPLRSPDIPVLVACGFPDGPGLPACGHTLPGNPSAGGEPGAIAEEFAARLGGFAIRIGLAWAGNPSHRRDAERSLPVSLLNRLEAIPGVAWHGFQLGGTEEPSLPGYISLAPLLSTFADTAYAFSGMSLVITVDSVLAHLAGHGDPDPAPGHLRSGFPLASGSRRQPLVSHDADLPATQPRGLGLRDE